MIRVLVVDDQAMIRLGIRSIIDAQEDMTVVGEAENGERAVASARSARPDVVLMDVRMPVLDGLAATRRMLDPAQPGSHRPKVVVLTTFDLDDYVYESLRAGASGFLLKDSEPEEVLRAIRVVAGGEALLAPGVTRRLIEQFVDARPASRAPDPALNGLTDREREVLALMTAGRSNAEIASTLFIAEQTTKSHVSKVLQKLHLRDRVQAVVYGYENGLVRPGSGG
ncbi:response regulator [Modestobacter roseus]|uniref:Two component transcriptional regulator, LuxR family n=1 Tax=Modestobacter roseus TaxID=1181884 RepID=A0A562IPH9_9ACTN|nr:response regulator transcription factor [Modestobacter roseus]MQA34344.1 response regulator [Modestobacter roseus]TWH72939.1 two component transcriptional regulator, LuxR family [Modestobacter roseus]